MNGEPLPKPTAPRPQRGPRQRLSEDERRRQIMVATIQEVAERGYESTSLTRIAARADVAKGLVWHYFAGKDDLMEQTAKATMDTLRGHIVDALDLSLPVPDIIRAALRAAAEQIRTRRTELIALTRIAQNLRGTDGERVTADFYEQTYRGQEDLFRRGQAEGSLGDFDTRVMAVTYQGSIDIMLAYLEEHPDVEPHDYAAKLAEILLGGMQTRS
ncbi:TetR/AcrR family transcriptional regulator [Pseudonocardia sp. TRM90224]|uniref:TetR/AcrR family transcriptional regulator n=1 Tax=Pseudonocardia sp. TRM90224 TaxID=2812678 RepID=UPI001E47A543|nr:TetR/AcrR family transcriptional regulator [Pseudonocardia sp. TRM90224]